MITGTSISAVPSFRFCIISQSSVAQIGFAYRTRGFRFPPVRDRSHTSFPAPDAFRQRMFDVRSFIRHASRRVEIRYRGGSFHKLMRLRRDQLLEQRSSALVNVTGGAVEAQSALKAHGGVNRRETLLVFDVELRAMIGEILDDLVPAFLRRAVQGRVAFAIDGVDVAARLQAAVRWNRWLPFPSSCGPRRLPLWSPVRPRP